MNFRTAFFVSIILNVILAAAWILKKDRPSVSAQTNIAPAPQTTTNARPTIVRLDWRSVESADYKEYVKNLRAIGCPDETVFDIIVADVNTLYAMKARSLAPATEWKFWEAQDEVPSREEIQNQKLRRELENEKRALIAAILGAEALDKLKKYQLWGREDLADRKMAFLPEEKRSALKKIQEKYFDLEQSASEWDANGVMTEETMHKLADLQKQRRAEIESLLTPQELEDYDLRTSEPAERLRHQLAGSHPTEKEFRVLYQIRKAYEDHLHVTTDVRDPNALQARVDLQNRLTEKAKSEFGDQRYAEFLRSQDIDYQNTLRMTQFFGLPENAAADVYDLKQRDATVALQIAENPNFTEDQRNQLFSQMEAEAENRLKQILGDRVFAEYKRNNRWWMRSQ